MASPSLAIIGSSNPATYFSGNGSFTLVFKYFEFLFFNYINRYIVGINDNSEPLDYASANALTSPLFPLTDSSGNPAITTLSSPGTVGSLASISHVIIDTIRPFPTSLTSNSTNGFYGANSNIYLFLNFQKNVYIHSGTPFLSLNVDSLGSSISFIGGSSTNILIFSYFEFCSFFL